MKAVRLYEGSELRIEEVPEPQSGPGEIRIAIQAAGVCGTDLHVARGRLPVPDLPVIMGHEGAGIVDTVGEGVTDFSAGDRVLLLPSETCGTCSACQRGHLGLCPRAQIFGMARDGTFAEKVVAPASCAMLLPDTVPFEHGAILADAVATAYHAVSTRAGIEGGERVAVIGCGGVGYHAILLARLLGAERIVAIDASEGALRRAEAAGADVMLDARDDDIRKAIRRAAGGEGPDVVIEYVGKKVTVELAMASVARGGRVIVGGVGMESPELGPLVSFVGKEIGVLGSMGYTRSELERVVSLAESGHLDLSGSITDRYPLERAAEALDDLANHRNDPVRLALIPG
ncbi:MAG: zinc-binding dehydrogenase, partial [Deltaproteobacteria bacterium]|nr:zinc-binding dehydrogenase [Deltaproteobacteria bacterium]